jgi:hypothetical protein
VHKFVTADLKEIITIGIQRRCDITSKGAASRMNVV